MKKILFIRSGKAFLPEINAYINYFNKSGEFEAFDSSNIEGEYILNDFDIIWEFKGIGGLKVKDQILIHEYASLSTGAFPRLKNILKTKLNYKPYLRIFLNEDVRKEFNFKDNIDYCYRDMGIDESFLKVENGKKEFDFVYVGSISKEREIDKLLRKFTENNNGNICLIGDVEDKIFKKYKNNKNIIFTGKVSYEEVPKIASKAEFGINFIPDKYPFNIQTSTKLLEYLALGLKVVTTDYKWVRKFEKKYKCSFYKLNKDLQFNIEDIQKYKFISNFNAKDFLWDSIFKRINLIKKIKGLA
ncbi:glycosyltransferase [Caldibacillus debilis]|uniref:Glycosyltransferase n=1 Tax=Caldibacillus debilis GB1 TaxID=1339248 RepID=A0A420VH11_9BACI|nr:glycosyltransferase [Caldibacillus debilis]RKO62836.1 Glycosyltransferase [Caldibacillus debilis GB1]